GAECACWTADFFRLDLFVPYNFGTTPSSLPAVQKKTTATLREKAINTACIYDDTTRARSPKPSAGSIAKTPGGRGSHCVGKESVKPRGAATPKISNDDHATHTAKLCN
ncbi:unnamed protein product, partial [Ectocarpus fasciculatus]